MELGMRDWFLIVGGVMIAGVLAHGAWLLVKSRRDAIGTKYERNIPDIDVDDIDLLRGELPSGGARLIRESAPDTQESFTDTLADGIDDEPRSGQVNLDEQVPVLMDPIDRDVAAAQRAEPEEEVESYELGADTEFEDDPLTQELAAIEAPGPLDEPVEDAPPPDAPSVTQPEPERTAAGVAEVDAKRAPEPEPPAPAEPVAAPSAEPEPDHPEQAPLFAGEPIVAREPAHDRSDQGGRAERAAGKRGAKATAKATEKANARSRRQAEPEPPAPEPAPTGPPEEVIVINVLCRGGNTAAGPTLVSSITDHGMRFGDMNIFHRYAPGDRSRIDFSLASAVEPGTFDLGAMDDYRTPGITMFLQLPGPTNPLEAFEDMVSIARGIATRIGGDLKDDHHSVMTAQTVEHCRQRIREFSRRQMSRRG